MPTNLFLIIVVAVIALIFGAIAGYLGSLVEGRLTNSLDEARGGKKPEDPEYVEPLPVVTEHSILKVTIDPALKLKLTLDDIAVEAEEMTPEQRLRLRNVILQIRPWIDGKTMVGAEPIAPLPTPEPPPAAAILSTPIVPTVPSKRIDPRRGFISLLESDVKKPEPLLENNLIKLIDEVLQKKLETSRFANKSIRIEAGPTGEVIVYVGSARYNSIDDVPDPAIREIIQDAIKEWNEK